MDDQQQDDTIGELMRRHHFIVFPDWDGYTAFCPTFPGVAGTAKEPEAALLGCRGALRLTIEAHVAAGRPLPELPQEHMMRAYALYDKDPRVHGPDDYNAFRDAVKSIFGLQLLEGRIHHRG